MIALQDREALTRPDLFRSITSENPGGSTELALPKTEEFRLIYITAVHMSGGTRHEHIASVRWMNPTDRRTGQSTRSEMIDWIRNRKGDAQVRDRVGRTVKVGVVKATPAYLRTYADRAWTDNLLALPRY